MADSIGRLSGAFVCVCDCWRRTRRSRVCVCVRRFRHYLPTAATYAVSVSTPECLQVPATVAGPVNAGVWEGVEVSLDVVFEPEAVGSVKAELRVSSPEGGLFVWPVHCVCEPARPRGPFPIPKAAPVPIDIKNVLREDKDFTLTTDNPSFTLTAPTVRIGAKKAAQISVKYTPMEGQPPAGKLIVTCPSAPDLPPWVYYLSGV